MNNNTETKQLLEIVSTTFGKRPQTPKDFEKLKESIFDRTHEMISVSTLKRTWGYVESDGAPRTNTLDILARYIGYVDWPAFLSKNDIKTESNPLMGKSIMTASLTPGDEIRIMWKPNRDCIFRYEGNERFRIITSHNSKLQEETTFRCSLFIEKEPLFISDLVLPDGAKYPNYVCGRTSGIHIA